MNDRETNENKRTKTTNKKEQREKITTEKD